MEPNEHVLRAKGQIQLARDAIRRCVDGLDSHSFTYSLDQIERAHVYLCEARWRIDAAFLIGQQDVKPKDVSSLPEEVKP